MQNHAWKRFIYPLIKGATVSHDLGKNSISTVSLSLIPSFPLHCRCRSPELPDVFNVTYRFSRFKVPPHVTNYMCQAFTFPNGSSFYHMVASQPLIDNAFVLHHMIIFGCSKKPRDDLFLTPTKCSMSGSAHCNTAVGGWTLGDDGDCWENDAGVLIGRDRK